MILETCLIKKFANNIIFFYFNSLLISIEIFVFSFFWKFTDKRMFISNSHLIYLFLFCKINLILQSFKFHHVSSFKLHITYPMCKTHHSLNPNFVELRSHKFKNQFSTKTKRERETEREKERVMNSDSIDDEEIEFLIPFFILTTEKGLIKFY